MPAGAELALDAMAAERAAGDDRQRRVARSLHRVGECGRLDIALLRDQLVANHRRDEPSTRRARRDVRFECTRFVGRERALNERDDGVFVQVLHRAPRNARSTPAARVPSRANGLATRTTAWGDFPRWLPRLPPECASRATFRERSPLLGDFEKEMT